MINISFNVDSLEIETMILAQCITSWATVNNTDVICAPESQYVQVKELFRVTFMFI